MTQASVIVFPGSNCDRDIKVALEKSGATVKMVWHGDSELPKSDLVILPGGFSYGDYLRSGAIAAHSPIMREIKSYAEKGGNVVGICNGFQILTETGLLPGTLMRNKNLKFICKYVNLRVTSTSSPLMSGYNDDENISIPIAHHDGNYRASADILAEMNDNQQIALRYSNENGEIDSNANPNGSIENIAGVTNKRGNVLGMMPHPERAIDNVLGGTDGARFFNFTLGCVNAPR